MAIAPHHFFILEPVSAAKLFSLIAMGIGYSAPHPRSIPLHDRQGVLAGEKSLEGIARLILSGRARRIVVLTGAGVSVSAGIPDFRTPGSGLYSNLEKYSLRTPQDIFDIAFFRADAVFPPRARDLSRALLSLRGALLRTAIRTAWASSAPVYAEY